MTALVTGWGRNTSAGPQSNILEEAAVTTLTNRQCRASTHRHDKITENMICTGAAGSGGPLAVLGQDGSYRQIGVFSWGRENYPGVYTRLTALLPWLTYTISAPGSGC